jgi:nitroimidazol reductase NimA-like FMN-containing flavoprotein (pyridoxamine 5'-phosphate oxidase superfamily)
MIAEHYSEIPSELEALLDRALVGELSVIGPRGTPVSYPLIPLYEGGRIYMTSSVLFSRKLDHIKSNSKVSISISDEHALAGTDLAGATIKGDARVIEDDLHSGWMRLLPLWRAKEPAVDDFLKKRFAMPLFWERAIIEITPRKVYLWRRDK